MPDVLTSTDPVEVRIGLHRVRWEPPDLCYITYSGDLDGETATQLNAESRKITGVPPRLFLLVNMAKMGRISKEARSNSAAGSTGLAICGIAIVGASAQLRIIAGLVSRAVELMQREHKAQTRFFVTEAEGRQWIEQRRRTMDAMERR